MNMLQAASSRLNCVASPSFMPAPRPSTDAGRAPITFGWLAYTAGGRTSRYFHLETLYRLDRVGTHLASRGLVPSQYYGISEEQLRELLRVRQAALLPRLPTGYLWVGPQLIENIEPGTQAQLAAAAPAAPRWETEPRLQLARNIAVRVLKDLQAA